MASGFTYVYKTSDGRRHTAEMSAASREEVFETLRRRGIKAIKVIANDGSKANGERESAAGDHAHPRSAMLAVIALGVAAVAVAGWFWLGRGKVGRSREYVRLEGVAGSIRSEMDSRIAALDIDLLRDWAVIENAKDVEKFYASIERANGEVESAKEKLRAAFKDVERTFSDPRELGLAQKLYGDSAEAIDAVGQAIAFHGYAFMLLDENRGKWRTERDGETRRIVWSDDGLKHKFDFYSKGGVSAATMRWKRDLAPTR